MQNFHSSEHIISIFWAQNSAVSDCKSYISECRISILECRISIVWAHNIHFLSMDFLGGEGAHRFDLSAYKQMSSSWVIVPSKPVRPEVVARQVVRSFRSVGRQSVMTAGTRSMEAYHIYITELSSDTIHVVTTTKCTSSMTMYTSWNSYVWRVLGISGLIISSIQHTWLPMGYPLLPVHIRLSKSEWLLIWPFKATQSQI